MAAKKRRKPTGKRTKKKAGSRWAAQLLGPLRRGGLLRRWALTFSLGLVLYACFINGIVRYVGGGAVHPLSLTRLPDKTRAVGLLAVHFALHPFRTTEATLPNTVARAARKSGISPRLAQAVTRTESSYKPHAISSTGAMGLMQLMPSTAKSYDVTDPFDAAQNSGGGTRLLRDLLKRYRGDRKRALAAYNAGPGRVPRKGPYALPRETRGYVKKITRLLK